MVSSCERRFAGPGVIRDSMSVIAQGCRRSAARVEIDLALSTVRQFDRSAGSSISANTRSTMPSRMSSLFRTWR